jgi:hypothetical protein
MELLDFQDKRWIVKMKTPDMGISSEKLEWFKWYKQADMVLKKNGLLYFVEEIKDIEFEEISENS